MAETIFSRFSSAWSNIFFSYSSVREVQIRNTYVGSIHRILQFIVFAYIFLYIVWTRKGYQIFETPRGSSVMKVKGVGRVSIENKKCFDSDQCEALWDASEYAIPPLEENAFFIATRKLITSDQSEGTCPNAESENVVCNSTQNSCEEGKLASNTFGFLTGKCLENVQNGTKDACEVKSWCPEELSKSTDNQMNSSDLHSFTVFIKTIVSFSNFQTKLRTVKDDTNFACRFHVDKEPRCPIFRIGYIIENIREKDPTVNLTALYYQGGLIEIEQDWRCNFDFEREQKECFPTYKFKLLQSGDDRLSPGINYRFVDKYQMHGKEYRTLTKVYGLRFILTITGQAGKFDLYYLFLSVGSGISCLMLADLISEFLFLYFHKKNDQFRENKITMCYLNDDLNIQSNKF